MVNIINELIGKIIIKIDKSDDEILLYLSNGAIYKQYHEQDCCECVNIDDIEGDLDDLIGNKLIQAEESYQIGNNNESETWSFYKFATIKGYVTIRWYGWSNGYYSESACIKKIKDEDPIKEQRRKKLNKLSKLNERLY